MMKFIKYSLLIICMSLFASQPFAQLKMIDLSNIKLGTSYFDEEEKQKIMNMFTREDKEYNIFKGDFLNTYRIRFTNSQFDYYGVADYKFQYVKDSLSDIDIEFNFQPSQISEFERFIKMLISDLNSDNYKRYLKKISTLNIDSCIRVAETQCKPRNEGESLIGKTLGRGIWTLKDKSENGNRYVMVDVTLSAGTTYLSDERSIYFPKTKFYDGTWMKVNIKLFNDLTYDLYLLNENQTRFTYKNLVRYSDKELFTWDNNGKKIIIEKSNHIKLKDENGVYKIPVKLNNILDLDFVLDLGAADISLSQDIFSVLQKAGTITKDDYIGAQVYQLADGSKEECDVYNLKSIRIGSIEIKNIRASISKSLNSPLLLGLSALTKLKNYKIDVDKKLLIIE